MNAALIPMLFYVSRVSLSLLTWLRLRAENVDADGEEPRVKDLQINIISRRSVLGMKQRSNATAKTGCTNQAVEGKEERAETRSKGQTSIVQ
eukprot:scaffold6274_cov78-Skeletonema_dohrnii-CCMP3373.AAC.2